MCLDNHFGTEQLTGNNKRGCNECNRKRDTNTRISIFEPPNVLVVHLKRFRYDTRRSKIEKFVQFPLQLNMSKYCDASNPANWVEDETENLSCIYSLYATTTHHGTKLSSGHYTCNVKTPGNKWLYKSDLTVFENNVSNVLSGIPSLLFYKRQKKRKNSIMHNFFKALEIKGYENEHAKQCSVCGESLDTDACDRCVGCKSVYHFGCVDWDANGNVICQICQFYDDYE